MAGVESLEGILSVVKPPGPTSHDVVRSVRRLVPHARVGHAGTLDPAASGVVVVCVGAYTRVARFFTALDKEYTGVLFFGRSTDTLDLAGCTVRRGRVPDDLFSRVESVMPAFMGEHTQVVPTFSAAKWSGRPLYRWTRAGVETPVKEKRVELHRAEIRPHERSTRRINFQLVTGSGFYVRAWARDIGDAVGVPAVLGRLTRTRVGHLHLSDAVALDDLSPSLIEARIMRGRAALPWLPWVVVDDAAFSRLCQGEARELPDTQGMNPVVAVADHRGTLGLIARVREGKICPWIVLRPLCGGSA